MVFHAFMSLCFFFTFVFAGFCCEHFCFLCFCSCWGFQFFRFLVPSWQRNQKKSFYCQRKYFAKESLRAPAWTSAKFCCRNKMGNPERAVSLHLARSCSQSEHRIHRIWPARGPYHITKLCIALFSYVYVQLCTCCVLRCVALGHHMYVMT